MAKEEKEKEKKEVKPEKKDKGKKEAKGQRQEEKEVTRLSPAERLSSLGPSGSLGHVSPARLPERDDSHALPSRSGGAPSVYGRTV